MGRSEKEIFRSANNCVKNTFCRGIRNFGRAHLSRTEMRGHVVYKLKGQKRRFSSLNFFKIGGFNQGCGIGTGIAGITSFVLQEVDTSTIIVVAKMMTKNRKFCLFSLCDINLTKFIIRSSFIVMIQALIMRHYYSCVSQYS